MAAFDDALNQQNPQIPIPIPDPNRMAFLEGPKFICGSDKFAWHG